jgi:hypothetical protein
MEPRRISASPRPCSGRRVVAKKRPRKEAFVSSVRKLQRREISSRRDRSFAMSAAQERFCNIHLQVRPPLARLPAISIIHLQLFVGAKQLRFGGAASARSA